jgi:hypothetical protein
MGDCGRAHAPPLYLHSLNPAWFGKKLALLRAEVPTLLEAIEAVGVTRADWVAWERGDFQTLPDERYRMVMNFLGKHYMRTLIGLIGRLPRPQGDLHG